MFFSKTQNKNDFKKLFRKIFGLYKEDAELVFVLFGIKIKFKYPCVNRLEELCAIPHLQELLDKNTKFPHPIGIVINPNAIIGKNCTIFHNVTIGDSFSDKKSSRYPTIGDNVTIFANVLILGGLNIGNNAIIGAGAVVLHDVPENSVVVGNPARIIKQNKV